MPLVKGKSKSAVSKNIKTEIAAASARAGGCHCAQRRWQGQREEMSRGDWAVAAAILTIILVGILMPLILKVLA
jgi:hypothetical protein